ncbi:MAG TPA: nucleotidyl transferase AbiEii/AbiGii toxin family protein [Thermoanaerobaculia bacterium]
MSGGKLSALQWRVLELLSALAPPWTLTGGGALVGFHLKHRTTRDLDLFWHGLQQLESLPEEVRSRLVSEGLEVSPVQSGATFVRLRVRDGAETCILDLVADPVATIESPLQIRVGRALILIDTPHEILVNKLNALLSRSELRDLEDVKALLAAGGDLERALADASKKDGGFSPLTLSWVLKELRPASLAQVAGVNPEKARELEIFRNSLVERILQLSPPEGGPDRR